MTTQTWDTQRYQTQHDFVWEYGAALVDLLAPQPGEHILDLGCGPGQLTQALAQAGALVEGIDADPAMIAQAQQNYPELTFRTADARNFEVASPLDAVFSNAVLHWVSVPEAVVQSVGRALKPGGRFVAEFGGKGNVQTIVAAVEACLHRPNFWYFPSVAEYASLLEANGFEVTFAALIDRPTPLKAGEQGLANWLRMFGDRFFANLSEAETISVIRQVEDRVRSRLYRDNDQNSGWIADYRRLRIVTTKLGDA
ncbi:MAG: methyltransferase domain-containing protein [Cyanobacteria bacterium P01_G01_bin.38]